MEESRSLRRRMRRAGPSTLGTSGLRQWDKVDKELEENQDSVNKLHYRREESLKYST